MTGARLDTDDAARRKNLYARVSLDHALPVYFQPWWLDIVCGDREWGVSVSAKGDEVDGVLPYVIDRRFGVTVVTSPPFTQYLGPIYLKVGKSADARASDERRIANELVRQLPVHSAFFMSFGVWLSNWTPFYLNKFEQTTKYTYLIDDIKDREAVWSSLSGRARTDVRKARKTLTVSYAHGFDDLVTVVKATYERQGMKLPYDIAVLRKVYEESSRRNCGRICCVVNSDLKAVSAALVVWDSRSAYYLVGGTDPRYRSSGAGTLCLWSAIEMASSYTEAFDFYGSMVESIAKFFRGFGAKAVPYSRVMRFRSTALRVAFLVKMRRSGKI